MTLQVLEVIPVTEDISGRCLRELQAICSHHGILPSSHIISGGLIRVGDYPVTSGGFSDVWEGTHNSIKVCIKCPKITTMNRQDIERVGNCRWHTVSDLLMYTCRCIDVLQGSSRMEKVETSEYRSLYRRYTGSFAICVRVDAKRRLKEVPWQQSRCESHRSGESPPPIIAAI